MTRKKLIIHAPNWVGDHVMAFPFYLAVQEIFVGWEKVLIGRNWVSSLLPENIFDHVFTFDDGKNFSQEKMKQLMVSPAEIGITLSPSFRSVWVLRKMKAKRIIGYRDRLRSLFISSEQERGSLRIPPVNHFEHRSLSYLRLLNPFLQADIIAEDLFFRYRHVIPQVQITPEKKKSIEEIFGKLKLKKNTYLVICPGSVASSKIYPVKHLVSILKQLYESQKLMPVVFVGSGIEKPFAAEIINLCAEFMSKKDVHKKLVDLTTKTDLAQLQFILKNARGVIANDSGVAHLTSLSHTPLVSFQGMGRKEETIPLNLHKKILTLDLACSPCFAKECPRRDFPLECLEAIQPGRVLNALSELRII